MRRIVPTILVPIRTRSPLFPSEKPCTTCPTISISSPGGIGTMFVRILSRCTGRREDQPRGTPVSILPPRTRGILPPLLLSHSKRRNRAFRSGIRTPPYSATGVVVVSTGGRVASSVRIEPRRALEPSPFAWIHLSW